MDTSNKIYSDFDDNWDDPVNPAHSTPSMSNGNDGLVGGFGYVDSQEDYETVHDRVHDKITDWAAEVLTQVVDISDEARVASHCLSGNLLSGFLEGVSRMKEINPDFIHTILRVAIQTGYMMRREEEDGRLSL